MFTPSMTNEEIEAVAYKDFLEIRGRVEIAKDKFVQRVRCTPPGFWGGGFEQVNLLFGENPNRAVREWTKPFHEAGIQTHMLDRALNGLRMSPVPADVRKLF